jgi:hypothetical protein
MRGLGIYHVSKSGQAESNSKLPLHENGLLQISLIPGQSEISLIQLEISLIDVELEISLIRYCMLAPCKAYDPLQISLLHHVERQNNRFR